MPRDTQPQLLRKPRLLHAPPMPDNGPRVPQRLRLAVRTDQRGSSTELGLDVVEDFVFAEEVLICGFEVEEVWSGMG